VSATTYFGILGLIIAVTLFALLLNKEILTTSSHPVAIALGRVLSMAIIRLVLTFVVIVLASLVQSLA